jgi:hypothetical protein
VVIRRVTAEDGPLIKRLRLRALEIDPLSFGSTLAGEVVYSDSQWAEWANEGASGEDRATLRCGGSSRSGWWPATATRVNGVSSMSSRCGLPRRRVEKASVGGYSKRSRAGSNRAAEPRSSCPCRMRLTLPLASTSKLVIGLTASDLHTPTLPK